MTTATWVKIHGYVSIFFLPLAFIYAVTGALIIVDQRGALTKEKHVLQLENPSFEDLSAQKKLISDFLLQRGESSLPVGEPKLVRGEIYWGQPSSINLNFSHGEKPGEAVLDLRKPDLLFSLVILHRARGGRVFDYFGFAFALAMIAMYVSGIFIFWKIKAKRKALSFTFLGGTLITVLVIWLSL